MSEATSELFDTLAKVLLRFWIIGIVLQLELVDTVVGMGAKVPEVSRLQETMAPTWCRSHLDDNQGRRNTPLYHQTQDALAVSCGRRESTTLRPSEHGSTTEPELAHPECRSEEVRQVPP